MTAPVTKADPSFKTENQFVSYAYLLTGTTDPITGTTDLTPWEGNQAKSKPYIEEKLIKYYNTVPAKWAPASGVYYWPKDQYSQLTFFAWADGTTDPTAAGTQATCSKSTGVQFTDYDITATNNVNRDIMVAKIAADQKANTTSNGGSWEKGVPTVFQHILSSFDTKIKLDDKNNYDDVKFVLKSIDLLKVKTKNTYTQGVNATLEPKASGWGTPSDPKELAIFSGNMTVDKTTAQDVVETGYKILMPQEFTADTEQIKIVYEVTTKYAGTEVTEIVTVVKDLDAIYTNDWVAGSSYTLTITLGLDQILWDPAVENWTAGASYDWTI